MSAELHKRLEKEKHEYAYMLTPMFSLNYSEEYGRAATAFMRGAEHGYREALKVAKEWLKENTETRMPDDEDKDFVWVQSVNYEDKGELIARFEADMSKLMEEKK